MGAKATKEIGEEGELEDSKFSQQDHRQSGPKVHTALGLAGSQALLLLSYYGIRTL